MVVRTSSGIAFLWDSPGEVKGYPLQYSALENSMDSIVHGVTKSQTQLNDFHLTRSGIAGSSGDSVFNFL